MKVSDLKRIIEVPVFNAVKNNISKYTEFINIKDDGDRFIVQSYNGISAIETSLSKDYDLFTGCVLASDLYKFLNTLKDDDDVRFETLEDRIVIRYGKKGKFIAKSIPAREFPVIDIMGLCVKGDKSITLTDEFVNTLVTASTYCNRAVGHLNGIFINKGSIYSTDRSVLYKNFLNLDNEIVTYMPIELVKFIIKFKNYIDLIRFFDKGFFVAGKSLHYWYPVNEYTMPNFSDVLNVLNKSIFTPIFIDVTDELKSIFNRISEFSEFVKFSITGKIIEVSCDNISETIDTNWDVSDEVIFKVGSTYLKNVAKTSCNSIKLYKESAGSVKFIKCDDLNNIFEILIATIV